MVSGVLGVWYNTFPTPVPSPTRPLTVRLSATSYGLDYSGTYGNSQFFVAIFNLTKKLALLHFVMEKGATDGCI